MKKIFLNLLLVLSFTFFAIVNAEESNPFKKYNIGDAIYYNPYTGEECNSSNYWTMYNTESLCYRWNVVYFDSDELHIMLDHNINPSKIIYDSKTKKYTSTDDGTYLVTGSKVSSTVVSIRAKWNHFNSFDTEKNPVVAKSINIGNISKAMGLSATTKTTIKTAALSNYNQCVVNGGTGVDFTYDSTEKKCVVSSSGGNGAITQFVADNTYKASTPSVDYGYWVYDGTTGSPWTENTAEHKVYYVTKSGKLGISSKDNKNGVRMMLDIKNPALIDEFTTDSVTDLKSPTISKTLEFEAPDGYHPQGFTAFTESGSSDSHMFFYLVKSITNTDTTKTELGLLYEYKKGQSSPSALNKTPLEWGHGNDIAYDKKLGKLVISSNTPMTTITYPYTLDSTISTIKNDNGTKLTSYRMSSIAYDSEHDIYYGFNNSLFEFFQLHKKGNYYLATNEFTSGVMETTQTAEYKNGYIFRTSSNTPTSKTCSDYKGLSYQVFCLDSPRMGKIYAYNVKTNSSGEPLQKYGTLIKTYKYKPSECDNTELEGIGFTNYSMLLSYACTKGGKKYVQVYKVPLSEMFISVKYNLNGGKEVESGKTSISEKVLIGDGVIYGTNSRFVREGYKLSAWKYNSKTYSVLSYETLNAGSSDMDLTAVWNPIDYTITYNLDGGSVSKANPSSYNIETATFTLNNPKKTGYTFLGWKCTGDTTASTSKSITKGTTGNLTCNATWDRTIYTIEYELNGGVLEDLKTSYSILSTTFTLGTPKKTGYTFNGWKTSESSTPVKTVTIAKGSTGNRKYIADYSLTNYTITYNLDGSSVSKANPSSYNIETATFTLNNPKKTGYTFLGWKCTGDTTASTSKSITKGTTGNLTCNATWDRTIYTIEYELNGGVLEDLKTSYSVLSTTFTLGTPKKTGYTFNGWKTSESSTPVKTVTIAKGSTGNRKYIADYSLTNYTITYNLLGGVLSVSNPTVYNIDTETFTLNNPKRTGYTFLGWKDDSGVVSKSVTISKGMIGNKNYTAVWEVQPSVTEYTITYILDDAINNNPLSYTSDDETFTLNDPVKKGYTFNGWKTSESSDPVKTVTIPKGSTGNKTFIADFTPQEYMIVYNLSGSSLSDMIISYNILSDDIIINNPTKDGYTFNGWIINNSTTPVKDLVISKGSTGNMILFAYFTPIEYTISFDLSGLDYIEPIVYTVEDEDITLVTPKKVGYTFNGWKTSESSDPVKTVTIPKGSIGNRQYIADFTSIEYTITYELFGGTSSGNPDSYTIESNNIIINDAVKEGYTFNGWRINNSSTPTKNVSILKGSTGNKTFIADFTPIEYTISFDLSGADYIEPIVYTVEDEDITLATPKKVGYTFNGWKTSESSDPVKTVTIPKGSIGNRQYIADFSLDEYSITYNLAGGVNNNNPSSYTYETPDFSLNAPTREGFNFIGWEDFETEEVYESVIITKNSVGDRSFIALWESKNPESINYIIEDDYIYGIKKETPVSALVDDSYTYAIYNNENILKTNGYIGTSDKVKIYLKSNGSYIGTYDVVILGEITGDGIIDISDFSKIRKYFQKVGSLEDSFAIAADVTKDGVVDISDYSKHRKYLQNIISSF